MQLFAFFSLIFLACSIAENQATSDSSELSENDNKGLWELLFSEYLGDCDCRCGVSNREARILGGEYIRTYEFPWLALIQVQDKEKDTIQGTLINDRYILTSTSQMIGLTPYDIKVTLGQFDRCFPDVTSQNVSVSSIILNPNFSPGNRAHDIALIKLTTPLKFEKRISPICLPFPGHKYTGQVATVVGWAEGPQADGQVSTSCRPRKAGLPVLSNEECAATAFDPAYTSADKGCVGIVGTRSIICGADAGGPVMYRSYGGIYDLIGVLSDRNDCSQRPSTALYTYVNVHLMWIKDNTKDACYCVKSEF